MNCPKCESPAAESDDQCPRCGILFSKWQERETNISQNNWSRYQMIANATSSEFNWTILIIISIALGVTIWFFGHTID